MALLIGAVRVVLNVLWSLIILDALLWLIPGTARHPLVKLLCRLTPPIALVVIFLLQILLQHLARQVVTGGH